MDFIVSIILGLVEAITEFLPISSTGHLILVNQYLTFSKNISEEFTNMFEIVIQLGAILAVAVYFRKRLLVKKENIDLWKKVIIAVIPALFFGFLLDDLIQEWLFNPYTVAIALLIGGIIILFVENKKHSDLIQETQNISLKKAVYIGLIQCLAMIPGTSRSAATIIGARLLGCSRIAATEFSFFLAIPTMIAASGYSLLKTGWQMSSLEVGILVVGFITAFVAALFVVKFFLQFVSKHDFKVFGYYRIILGLIIITYFIFK